MKERMNGQTDRQTNEKKERQMDRWMDKWTDEVVSIELFCSQIVRLRLWQG